MAMMAVYLYFLFGYSVGTVASLLGSLLLLAVCAISARAPRCATERRYKKGYISRYRQVASVRMVNDEDSLAPSACCAPKLSLSLSPLD